MKRSISNVLGTVFTKMFPALDLTLVWVEINKSQKKKKNTWLLVLTQYLLHHKGLIVVHSFLSARTEKVAKDGLIIMDLFTGVQR